MFDPSLYLVVNPLQCANADPLQTALEAVDGGVTAVQLRNKPAMGARHFEALVDAAVSKLKAQDIPVIVNDDVELARRCAAQGVHLGQSDLPAPQARQMLGEAALIGITVRSAQDVHRTSIDDVDYVSVGGVFATRSKSDAGSPIGTGMLGELVALIRSRNSNVPVIAISGINSANIEQVLATGISGIAAVSAICQAASPKDAASQLRRRIDEYRRNAGAQS